MSLEEDINALSKVGLLSDFTAEHLRLIAFGSNKLSFSKGYEVFQQGRKSDGGYLILSGKINMTVRRNGKDYDMGDFGPGSILGELALISQNERAGTAVVTESCVALKVTRTTMHRILSEYPDLAVLLHQRISSSVIEFTSQLTAVQQKLSS